MIAVARVLRPHGLRGGMVVSLLTSGVDRLQQLSSVWVGRDRASATRHDLRRVRQVGRRVVVELEGIGSPEAAERIRGCFLMIDEAEALPLPEGEYYCHDIVGCEVVDEAGVVLGVVEEVIPMPAQDVYVVCDQARRWWFPAAKALIRSIDTQAKRITVNAIDGLVDIGPPG